jgi:hypothetical protein
LPARAADPGEERLARQLPRIRERTGQLLGRVVAAVEATLAVGRHERDDIGVRTRQPLCDDARRLGAKAPETALLPAANDRTNVGVVGNRRACLNERKPPARAFAAAYDRPCRGGAATRA